MSGKTVKTLEKILQWGLVSLVFLLPLFFLPLTTEFYEFNKNILLLVISCLLLIAWAGKMVVSQEVHFKTSPFDLPVLGVAFAFILSTVFASPNKVEALLAPGATGTILALTIFYFLVVNNLQKNLMAQLLNSLVASGLFLALIAIYQFLGLGEAFSPLAWLKPKFWTPAGGLLPLATFLTVSLTLVLRTLIEQIKNKLNRSAISGLLSVTSGSLIAIGLAISIYQLLTTAKPFLLPYSVGWAVAIEALKNIPLLGVGPANFLSAFSQFKPLTYNLGSLWSILFATSSNWYFQLLTTTGVLGLGAFLWLVWRIVKEIKNSLSFGLLVLLALMLFLPPNFLLLFVFYLLLACLGGSLAIKEYRETSRILPWLIFLPLTLLVLLSGYFLIRAYTAEFYFRKSLQALVQNQGTQAYNLQIQAITLNPYQTNFHATYSQTNFVLAQAIAATPPVGGLTDQDRQNISVLVQQAIREAKTAVALNPQNFTSWENLALIYRGLINFAEGADGWTIASYNQAIALHPTSPLLRVSLGGVYYSLGNWDEAARLFEQAANLKPDFANAHYNLAATWREKGDFAKASQAMEKILSLVPPDSEDYQKAANELEALKKRLAEKEAKKPSETLIPPEPLPTGIKPPLSLPPGAAPEVSPTPIP